MLPSWLVIILGCSKLLGQYAVPVSHSSNEGFSDDHSYTFPSNVSTVIDLLEDRGISWGEYEEDMPYSGFEGVAWVNQRTGANDYVRKHNPASQ